MPHRFRIIPLISVVGLTLSLMSCASIVDGQKGEEVEASSSAAQSGAAQQGSTSGQKLAASLSEWIEQRESQGNIARFRSGRWRFCPAGRTKDFPTGILYSVSAGVGYGPEYA